MFVSPIGIVPGTVRKKFYKSRAQGGGTEKLSIYSYQWEDHVEAKYDEWEVPPAWDPSKMSMGHTWSTRPTRMQLEYINSGSSETGHQNSTLPSTFHAGLGIMVDHYAHYNGEEYGYEIINNGSMRMTRLFGFALLRTCQQIAAEATEILYKENTFVFPTQAIPRFSVPYALHRHDELTEPKYVPWKIPRCPSKDGSPATQKQIRAAVDRMFDRDAYQPPFLRKDPLTRFFSEIQRDNTSQLRSVMLQGICKTARLGGIGFAKVLSTQSLVLKEVCTNLQTLVLHSIPGHNDGDSHWEELQGDTDDEKFEGVMRKVVLGLPTLHKLQLGSYWDPPETEEWGASLKWSMMVMNNTAQLKTLRAEEAQRLQA